MRTKPRVNTCSRNRRRNSSAVTVILRFCARAVILPSECDDAVSQGHETVVGDVHAVRIAGQILEYVFWSAKRRLGINHSILAEQLPQKGVKWFGLAPMFELPMEVEFPLAKEALPTGDELATKDAAE